MIHSILLLLHHINFKTLQELIEFRFLVILVILKRESLL